MDEADEWLFTENETNSRRLYNLPGDGHFKDAFHEYVVDGNSAAVNPAHTGSKTAAHISREVPAGSSIEVKASLQAVSDGNPFEYFDEVMAPGARKPTHTSRNYKRIFPIRTVASSNVRPWPG